MKTPINNADVPLIFSHGEKGRGGGSKKQRREKLFDANDIRLLMLSVLETRPAHGYELIKAIEDRSGGEYAPSPGIIYPNLTLMEEMGYIDAAENSGGKKAYRLADAGRGFLHEQRETLVRADARLHGLAVLANNRAIPEIERAIHEFRVALNRRLAREDVSPETLHTIIASLERAAREIEKS
ncbi:MAG: PadR family transcriptional regulator [Yersiniaceae bacterium]|nr:PadR family transcriptional regulator [Yersiniaceae bacterium]